MTQNFHMHYRYHLILPTCSGPHMHYVADLGSNLDFFWSVLSAVSLFRLFFTMTQPTPSLHLKKINITLDIILTGKKTGGHNDNTH